MPILSNCTPATDVIDAASLFLVNICSLLLILFRLLSKRQIYIHKSRSCSDDEFYRVLSLVDTTKDKKKMDMVRKCTLGSRNVHNNSLM